MYEYKLQSCPDDCTSNHKGSDVFVRQRERVNSHFIIDSQINVCQLKWKLACDIIKDQLSIKLTILKLNTKSIQKDYSLLSYDCIEAATLRFEGSFHTSNQKQLDDLFNYLQKAANLKDLKLYFKSKIRYIKHYQTTIALLGTNFQAKKGSLVNLESLSITFFHIDVLEFEILPLELSLIDPAKNKGNLKLFKLESLGSHAFDEATYLSISRILRYNQDSIRSVGFTVFNIEASKCHPLIIFGESFSKLTQLNEIILDIGGQTGTIDSNFLFEGISKGYQNNTSQSISQTISLNFYNNLITDGSKLGSCLLNFSNVKYQSNLSISAATEIGKALGNSERLQSLEIGSQTQELGHLLFQLLSSPGQLKDLIIRFQGNNQQILPEQINNFKSNKWIEKLTVEIEEIDVLSLSNFMNFFSETIATSKLLYLRIIINSFKGKSSQISKILEQISKLTNLQSLNILIQKIELMEKIMPEDLFLPLHNLKDLEYISFYFGLRFEVFHKEIFFIKLLSGLIWHPHVHTVQFPQSCGELLNIKKIANEFNSEVESIMANTIGFYKVLSPLLEFHPKRHLEDFYL